jgi:GntR family transcriptional regulator
VIRADGRPAAYLIDRLPAKLLDPAELPANFTGSVLDYLIARGDELGGSRAVIGATNAPADVAKPLEIQRDDVLLRFESQLFDIKGAVVDYSVSYFIPGYFNFHINRKVETI